MGVKTPGIGDRRVQRTRRALREALISLILERGYDAVGVGDIVRRADVGRSTFYTHFGDKEELLLSGFDDLHRALRQVDGGPTGSTGWLGFSRAVFDHAHDQRRLWRAIVGKKTGAAAQKRFRQLLVDLVRSDLEVAAPAPQPTLVEPAVHYIAGAFLELLTWWVEAKPSVPPAAMDDVFRRLTAPVLQAVMGAAIARPTPREHRLSAP